jgi:PHS family inorganic phosphate transporter-like MFS transporter
MGYVGDCVGRSRAMVLTLCFTVFGAFCSAVLPWGSPDFVYTVLAACRFILGVGIGGVYPLSAVKAAEGGAGALSRGNRVAWAFFWQAPGQILPNLVCALLVVLNLGPQVTFRLLLGLGCLPPLLILRQACKEEDSQEFQTQKDDAARQRRDDFVGAFVQPHATAAAAAPASTAVAASQPPPPRGKDAFWSARNGRRLMGAGVTWFLYDVVFYGTILFAPEVQATIFGESETVLGLSLQNALSTLMGIPGLLLSMSLVDYWGRPKLQLIGFGLIGGCFLLLAAAFHQGAEKESPYFTFALYCLLVFALNFGPNLTTFVLPSEMFPVESRSKSFLPPSFTSMSFFNFFLLSPPPLPRHNHYPYYCHCRRHYHYHYTTVT